MRCDRWDRADLRGDRHRLPLFHHLQFQHIHRTKQRWRYPDAGQTGALGHASGDGGNRGILPWQHLPDQLHHRARAKLAAGGQELLAGPK